MNPAELFRQETGALQLAPGDFLFREGDSGRTLIFYNPRDTPLAASTTKPHAPTFKLRIRILSGSRTFWYRWDTFALEYSGQIQFAS